MSDDSKPTRGRKRMLTDSGRKRNRKEVQASYQKARINIGQEIDRWNELKDALRLQSHGEVAKVLLDRYEQVERPSQFQTSNCIELTPTPRKRLASGPAIALTSTPGPLINTPKTFVDVSRIHVPSSDSEPGNVDSDGHMSGVEVMTSRGRRVSNVKLSQSFIDPNELSIETTEVLGSDDSDNDEDYQPTLNITMSETIEFGDVVDDEEDDEQEFEVEQAEQVDLCTGVVRLTTDEHQLQDFFDDHPCLVFVSQLLKLANVCISKTCSTMGCQLELEIKKDFVGSAIYLKWMCKLGHINYRWCSQPVMNRGLNSGDLMLASSIVLSGSNFQKVQMFSKFLRLPFVNKSTFFRIQRHYIIPSVDEFWIEHQDATFEYFRDQDLVILGDGRMDSPGHSAQYCSYTFMENTSKRILCIITMDKRATDRKSTNLEKACFLKGLKFLLDKELKIVEVVTDAHIQVASIMKKDYPGIKHSWDVWHGTKNLGKKIIKAGQDKKNKELLDWTKDIVNHYWYTAKTCNSKEDFVGMWIGVLHHVVNVHEWILSYSSTNKCEHGPLTDERTKEWLVKDSPAHQALRSIVLDKRLLKNVSYYINFRSTAELENFQNLILMYASKRHSYRPPAYRCRNLLAALDHNGHINRSVLTNKDGAIRYQRVFQKKSSRWAVTSCKTAKDYGYVAEIIRKIFLLRLNDNVGMNQGMVLEVDDPRRISAHLAPVPPPPTNEIVAQQRSRFTTDGSYDRADRDLDRTIDYVYEPQ